MSDLLIKVTNTWKFVRDDQVMNGTWVDSFLDKRKEYLIVPKGLVIVLNYSKYKVIWSDCVIKQVSLHVLHHA